MVKAAPPGKSRLRPPADVRPYLELPDAGALHGSLLHGAVHEGDEHVEQQDVGEDDVADEEHVEHLLVLVVFGELHVAHADGELEELQHGEGDVPVGGLYTLFSGLVGEKKTALPQTAGVPYRRLDQQCDHRCGHRTHTRKSDRSSAVLIYLQYLAKMKKTFDKIPDHSIPAENPNRKTTYTKRKRRMSMRIICKTRETKEVRCRRPRC